jgi:pyruvate dehydrogenase E1 component
MSRKATNAAVNGEYDADLDPGAEPPLAAETPDTATAPARSKTPAPRGDGAPVAPPVATAAGGDEPGHDGGGPPPAEAAELSPADPTLPNLEPEEVTEWIESLDQVSEHYGPGAAQKLIEILIRRARLGASDMPSLVQTPYINTIAPDEEPAYPGDQVLEKRIRRIIRWNAVAMVLRANKHFPGIGGHLSTYASAATLYEVGFNHFFRGKDGDHPGDLVYFQGHASPGIYARAFLEGRITREQMEHFRREVERGKGLSSYPHPWLMSDFWEFPTVSMGLGPISAIYQARFYRYLANRGIVPGGAEEPRVWAFVGDGETDEPEALGSLSIAAREKLDNLTFVVNCNLQRLDGPVRGNGKIIQELEAVFHGAGWNVIKVIWGGEWDALLARDTDGLLVKRMNEVVDGTFQRYSVEDGSYIRQDFFGADPRLLAMVEHLSDDEIERLRRGGHDARKVYAAYAAACEHKGAPTVILAKTVKGWTLGEGAEGRNVSHQAKKLNLSDLRAFRDVLELPIPDSQLEESPFYLPPADSPVIQYLKERRSELGGSLPKRIARPKPLPVPPLDFFAEFFEGSKPGLDVSTTMVFAKILARLLADPDIGPRIVPIIPDEARTFGLEALFKKHGIYSAVGQLYEPVDHHLLISYREAKNGQMIEEGITEAGSMASFTAAGTSYATYGQPMIPMYIFYSMFGFQRTGDQIWAAGDSRARGFLFGATAGRTTLSGEGLQHEDGHSHLHASTVPNCRAYDPAFAYEVAAIIWDGLRRMYVEEEDAFYYVTLQNENYPMRPMPEGALDGIIRGLYRFRPAQAEPRAKGLRCQLLGSGSIMNEVLKAQVLLAERFGVAADVWSATSYMLLRRDALMTERWNRLHPGAPRRRAYVEEAFAGAEGPIIAASDFMKAVPDQIARWVPGGLTSLGTDGFGRSDTREALRRHFEVDAESVAVAALARLAERGFIKPDVVVKAIAEFKLDPERIDPSLA